MASATRLLAGGCLVLGCLLVGCARSPEGLDDTTRSGTEPASTREATVAELVEPPVIENLEALDLDPTASANIQAAVTRLRAEPRSWLRWLDLGMLYHANEILPEARICYEQAIALAPEQARSYYYLGLLQGQIGEVDLALAAMREARQLGENNIVVHWRYGFLLLDAGDAEAALAAFEQALAINPKSEAALLGAGRASQQLQRFEDAASYFELALEIGAPVNRGHTQRLLAGAYQRLGRDAEAEQALALASAGDAIYDDPWASELVALRTSVSSRRDAALRLMDGGREAEALALLEALVQDAPEDPLALEALGVAYARLGRVDLALPIFERLVAEHPDNLAGPENLARALLHQSESLRSEGEIEAADASTTRGLENADRAIELAPERARAHGIRGDLLRQAGRYADASAAYREAARLDSRDSRWLAAAGRMELQQENWASAIEALREVTTQAPDDALSWRGLGIAYLRRGQLAEAASALDKAFALSPEDPVLQEARQELEASSDSSTP